MSQIISRRASGNSPEKDSPARRVPSISPRHSHAAGLLTTIAQSIIAIKGSKPTDERREEEVQALLEASSSWWILRDSPAHVRTGLCRAMTVDEVPAGRTINTVRTPYTPTPKPSTPNPNPQP